MKEICDVLDSKVVEVVEQHMAKAFDLAKYAAEHTRTSAFFFADTYTLLPCYETIQQVSNISIFAQMVSNTIYMYASIFDQGCDPESMGTGKRLKNLCADLGQLNKHPEKTWPAIVNAECIRMKLPNWKTHKKFQTCVTKLQKHKIPPVPFAIVQYAKAFCTLHAGNFEDIVQHLHKKILDLVVQFHIGNKKNSSKYMAETHHIDAILTLAHFKEREFLSRYLFGRVVPRLTTILCGVQRMFQIEINPITKEPKINNYSVEEEGVLECVDFWNDQTKIMMQIGENFLFMLGIFQSSLQKGKDLAFYEMHCKTDDQTTLEQKAQINRLDVHLTLATLQFIRVLIGNVRLQSNSESLCFLFTSACVFVERPEATNTAFEQIWSNLFEDVDECKSNMDQFILGFFEQECEFEEPCVEFRMGRDFVASARKILACEK
jgi:hypothetical protein